MHLLEGVLIFILTFLDDLADNMFRRKSQTNQEIDTTSERDAKVTNKSVSYVESFIWDEGFFICPLSKSIKISLGIV